MTNVRAPAPFAGARFRRRGRHDRRGVAIVLVLGFLAISFGLAYALLRGQAATMQLEGNYSRIVIAREAALSGALDGVRRMHSASWAGVDTSFAQSLTANSGYTVSYVTGDASLASGDADYDMWPYRVTINSLGHAQDPADPLSIATYSVQVVVELIPENIASEPAIWSVARQYSAYGAKKIEAKLNLLLRIEGSSRFSDLVTLGKDSPGVDDIRQRFMQDLNSMRFNGFGDYRQFNSSVRLPYSKQTGTANALQMLPYQGVSSIDRAAESSTLPTVGTYSSYRLYPGGAYYTPGTLAFYTRNVTLEPDPKTNPLGIFYSSSNIRIEDNVTLQGTIIDGGDIVIDGTNINLQAFELPTIDDGATSLQLPVMIVGDDVDVEDDTQMTVTGSIAAIDRFRFRLCGNGTSFSLQGNLLVGELDVNAWVDWPTSATAWNLAYTAFLLQAGAPIYQYFPDYLNKLYGYQIAPAYVIKPAPAPTTLHWLKTNEPLYAPATPGAGLKWQMIDWIDNP